MMDNRHEVYDPVSVDDREMEARILEAIKILRKKGFPYAFTCDDEYYYLWVEGSEVPMPDDGGDE